MKLKSVISFVLILSVLLAFCACTEAKLDVKLSAIPKRILNAEVTHMLLSGRHGEGRELFVYVDMPAMDVEMVKAELAPVERPLEEVT